MTHTPLLYVSISDLVFWEVAAPILGRLGQRGRVRVEASLGPRLRQTVPRVAQALSGTGVILRRDGTLRHKVGCALDVLRATAVMSHTDPVALPKATRIREQAMVRAGRPGIFLQHGLFQPGVVTRDGKTPRPYYADRLLVWDDPDGPRSALLPETRTHARRIGFPKHPVLAPHPGLPGRADLGGGPIVLVAHKWRADGLRLADVGDTAPHGMLARVAAAHPDTTFLLRPKRGRTRADVASGDEVLAAEYPNVHVASFDSGPFRGATFDDLIALSDLVVTTPSTAVLDAIYADRPTAILDNTQDLLADLPQVDGVAAFTELLARPEAGSAAATALKDRFGAVDVNLDRAAEVIEERLGAS
ncbi:hypothetical protein EKE94_03470 [Mesobaculum littorinae]|uniref:Uncharacterized protein n=1 Tax=Mesobaculum littorinae TaxID=2486419 RepID=A0A438ALW9_9RHOB|nr:hypothetical protein [Mesobaculum littorinae]RVV99748.1 hypothetical protein EKE94_03470 [Mesobaculum littorinae]